MPTKVAVTGGSGFIGSHVVDKLVDAGHEVVVIDHGVRPHRPDVTFADVDILDLASVMESTSGCEYVFHLAAVSNVNYALKYPVYTVELNVTGTTNVLEAARHNEVKRVVLASSVWVYTGARESENLDENTPFYLPDAGHIYTSTKIASELIVHSYEELYGQAFTILRYGIPYGPRMRDELVIPIFIRRALTGEPITIHGDGSQYRNYIYIDDLANAHVAAMGDQASNEVFNLEGVEKVSIRDLAETLRTIVGEHVEVNYLPGRPGDYAGKEVLADKARQLLGWDPQVPFVEGMRRTIDWFKQVNG